MEGSPVHTLDSRYLMKVEDCNKEKLALIICIIYVYFKNISNVKNITEKCFHWNAVTEHSVNGLQNGSNSLFTRHSKHSQMYGL